MADKYKINYDSLNLYINYTDDKGKPKQRELTIRRVKRSNLRQFIGLYDKVMAAFIEYNMAIAEMLLDDIIYQHFIDICKLIPVDNSVEGLDFTLIEDDYNLLLSFFFSTSWNWETAEWDGIDKEMFKTSLIGKFMQIEYQERMVKMVAQIAQKKRENLTILLNPPTTNISGEM